VVCDGTGGGYDVATRELKPLAPPSHFSRILRIDLAAKRWCTGQCETTRPITEVRPEAIVLEWNAKPGADTDNELVLNREDGTIFERVRVGSSALIYSGKCTKAAFTGFPSIKF
jgi:hypothetical protein